MTAGPSTRAPTLSAVGDVALAAWEAGLSIVPPKEDGSKTPIAAWKPYQAERPSQRQVEAWYGNVRAGLGVVTGAVSGGLECFEFDDGATLDRFLVAASALDLGDVVELIDAGYSEATPGGGRHWLYRCAL